MIFRWFTTIPFLLHKHILRINSLDQLEPTYFEATKYARYAMQPYTLSSFWVDPLGTHSEGLHLRAHQYIFICMNQVLLMGGWWCGGGWWEGGRFGGWWRAGCFSGEWWQESSFFLDLDASVLDPFQVKGATASIMLGYGTCKRINPTYIHACSCWIAFGIET